MVLLLFDYLFLFNEIRIILLKIWRLLILEGRQLWLLIKLPFILCFFLFLLVLLFLESLSRLKLVLFVILLVYSITTFFLQHLLYLFIIFVAVSFLWANLFFNFFIFFLIFHFFCVIIDIFLKYCTWNLFFEAVLLFLLFLIVFIDLILSLDRWIRFIFQYIFVFLQNKRVINIFELKFSISFCFWILYSMLIYLLFFVFRATIIVIMRKIHN